MDPNPNMNYGKFGRCEATAKSTGMRCGRPAVGEHGKCDVHGGNSPKGMDSPNAVHGIRSKYLSDEDRKIYEEVRQLDNDELIQEEIWMLKTKLLRASRAADGNQGIGLVHDLIEQIHEDQEVDEDAVRAFAKLLQTSEGAVDRALGRLSELVKTHHKITDGSDVNVSLQDLFGGGGSE